MDDFDIYGDLEKYESEAKKDSEEVQDLLRRIAELEKQLESKEQEKCDIEKKNIILAENISSLLLTAKAELKRKDTIIADLRKQCDNAAFRRGNQGPKPVGGKKREQATQTFVCHSRHTAVQTDLSKPDDCSDRKRRNVRELNGDDEARSSKRARMHEYGSSNRDPESDRERRREKDREREKDRYRDRNSDRLRHRGDCERSGERVRERSRDRHKPRTSDRDRERIARRERDPIKEYGDNRRSEVTDSKDRNRRQQDARSRLTNSSCDQQAKESVSSDHKSVPSNVKRKSVSKDDTQLHRSESERRTHSTKSNPADDVRDTNTPVKEVSDPAPTTLHSPDVIAQHNQQDNDKTILDTQNAEQRYEC
ncbi:serine/threonine-protein kinase prpf4B-like isoform X2 [Anopheles albimanus]|uniref:serine/threonine-protein kinase prpf4B-like isoform X2 n=1 Tax=Anopheles albimanus TaxID=7167 RepID=UPI0016413FC5|nr:serine/threonine-protein kinase prpf4B-like isoform X2 [Anopheles albimanus]